MTVLLTHSMPKEHNIKNPCSKGLWQVLFFTRKGVLHAKKKKKEKKKTSLGSVICSSRNSSKNLPVVA